MGLLKPSPGEVTDRLTILELKINAAGKSGKSPLRFVEEKSSLEHWLGGHRPEMGDPFLQRDRETRIEQAKKSLAAVNALIWEAIDQVVELSEVELSKLAMLAKRTAKLNMAREEKIRELNRLYRAEDGEEKMYGTTTRRVVKEPERELKVRMRKEWEDGQ